MAVFCSMQGFAGLLDPLSSYASSLFASSSTFTPEFVPVYGRPWVLSSSGSSGQIHAQARTAVVVARSLSGRKHRIWSCAAWML